MPRAGDSQPDFKPLTAGGRLCASLPKPHAPGFTPPEQGDFSPHADHCPARGYMCISVLPSSIVRGGQAGWHPGEELRAAGLPAAEAGLLGASPSPSEESRLTLEDAEPKPGGRDDHSRP